MNEEEKKLYEEFQDKFPIDKLEEMTLEKYTAISKEGFSFWILNDIFGTTNYQTYKINLGIYKYEKNPKFGSTKNTPHGFDDTYAWQYDTNRDRAFRIIKNRIIETATNAKNYSQNQDKQYLKNIDKINLPPVYKWKIAFLYSDRELINCYSVDKLKELLKNLQPNVKTSIPISDLQYQLIKIKKAKPTEFAKAFATLWSSRNKNNKNDNEDKTMTNTEEPILAQECAKLLKNTKNLILHGAPGTGKTYLAKEKIAPELAGLLGIKKEDVEIGFVQFHPSYDYTDFVEGIRPTTDGKFNLEDGIFKKFCEKAILDSDSISNEVPVDTQKNTIDNNSSYSNILETLDYFVKELEKNFQQHFSKSIEFFKNILSHNINIKSLYSLKIELDWLNNEFEYNEELKTILSATSNNLSASFKNLKVQLTNYLNTLDYQNDLSTCWNLLMQEASKHDNNNPLKIKNENYLKTSSEGLKRISNNKKEPNITLKRVLEIYEHKDKNKKYKQQCLKIIEYMSRYNLENHDNDRLADDAFTSNESAKKAPKHSVKKNSFVFIIDEINRGELSKIFGELFFSIDPGYRGKEGAILTQYANMTDKPNKFDDALEIKEAKENKGNYGHFFVPENVYIIGTMNDIDRSVESMDLAMRRRFTFKEITAEKSQEMILTKSNEKLHDISDKIIEELRARMKKLNDEIIKIEFSQDYQIGAAYFLKFADYYSIENDSDKAFNDLWDYNLEPLLREYLRGQGDITEKLKQLENAYKNNTKPEE